MPIAKKRKGLVRGIRLKIINCLPSSLCDEALLAHLLTSHVISFEYVKELYRTCQQDYLVFGASLHFRVRFEREFLCGLNELIFLLRTQKKISDKCVIRI